MLSVSIYTHNTVFNTSIGNTMGYVNSHFSVREEGVVYNLTLKGSNIIYI